MKIYYPDLGVYKEIDNTKIKILTSGIIENQAWNFTTGATLYLNDNGGFTETPPESGFKTIVGYALSPTTICFDPQTPEAVS